MVRAYYITNLHAGRSVATARLADILNQFTRAGWEMTIHPTQEKGDATQAAAVACTSGLYDYIVCCGGDGTLSETIQGCMESGAALPIGYIPTGSTNDFAYSLSIPTDPLEAVDCIVRGENMTCDIGQFNTQYFTYVAAFGTMTQISYETPQAVKNILGHTAYILNAIAQLPKMHAYPMRIEHDGEVIEDEFLYGMVTNSASVARFLALSEVAYDDGLFEVTLIRKPNTPAQMRDLIAAFTKLQIGSEKKWLRYFRTQRCTITSLSKEPVAWTLDGEYGGNAPVNIIGVHHAGVQLRIDPKRRDEGQKKGLAVEVRPEEMKK